MWVAGKRNGGRKGYLIVNSWNAYLKGDGQNPSIKNKYLDQPDGSFYISPADMLAILRFNDSWALSLTDDFRAEEMPSYVFDPNGKAPNKLAVYVAPNEQEQVPPNKNESSSVAKACATCGRNDRRAFFRR